MPPRAIISLLVLGLSHNLAAAGRLDITDQTVTTVQELRLFSPEEARTARPVKFNGVVTHINPHLKDFFLQDKTAGVYVQPTELAKGLTLGDQVELEGVSDPGAFSPCVVAKKITILGQTKLPDPFAYTLSTEDSRWLDSQWIQTTAVVRGIRTEANVTRLDIYNVSEQHAVVIIPGEHWASEGKNLKGLPVVVRGVCVPTFSERMISGPPRIFSTGLPQILVLPAEIDCGPEAPPRMIDHLLRFTPSPSLGGRRVKIAGVVTARPLPGVVVIQDQSGAAVIWSSPRRDDIPTGARIEAYGLMHVEGRRISLSQAKVAVLGELAQPAAQPINGADLSNGLWDSRLARVEAQLEGMRVLEGWTALTLLAGSFRFEAFIPGSPEQSLVDRLETGSRVAVVGVPMDASPDGKPGLGPNFFVAGPQALTLLESAPTPRLSWWSARRVSYLCGGFLAVTLCGGGWLFMLRHQVRKAATEVQQHYEEKAQLERQLRQAAKLEAVGRLAGGIAHDFNNLLTVINGCAELLADEAGRENGRLSDLARDIRQAGDRAAALTGQLLTFSRKGEVQVSSININDVVAESVRLLNRVIGENIHIQTSLANDLPLVCGEPSLLHQVIMNLAVNAKDAMPRGGTLSLATSQVIEPARHSPGREVSYRHFVRLTVADTGMGMSEEVKARIFEPFFTTKEVGSGTGLGLATVYGIIQTIRGKIHVDSTLGRGSAFHIDLRIQGEPLSDSDVPMRTQTPLPPRRSLNAARLRGTTLLVVEDNKMVRDLLVSGLKAVGATVLAAADPTQALRLLAEEERRVDVMVTDVVMPEMSGRTLADRVRLDYPSVQVLFMSGYTAGEVIREGILEDQVEFLQKPFTPDSLINRLVGILERRK